MKHLRLALRLAPALSLALPLAAAPLRPAVAAPGAARVLAQDEARPTAYVRVAADGAIVRNMADDQGTDVQKPAKGTLLAVYRDNGEWLEVETPGGYAVWVFGRYLTETATPDVYRVNGDGVNLRPRPKSGVDNFPLSQQLYAGDEVRVIERADARLPLAEDWVRVWSPPGVRAWIEKSATEPLPAGATGEELWKEAVAALPAAPTRAKGATRPAAGGAAASEAAAPAPAAAADQEARFQGAIDAAVARMEVERAKATPDWGAVEALFLDAERAASGGVQMAQVRQARQTLGALVEASALRARLENERRKREEAVRLEQEKIWAESREKDPLGGIFLARGALERVVEGAGEAATKRYYVRFGDEVVAQVVCVSGRYDLDLFVGYQVGVRGTELRAAEAGDLRHLEVTGIEVLARRP